MLVDEAPVSIAVFVRGEALSRYGVDLGQGTAEWIASKAKGFATRKRSSQRVEAVALLRTLFGGLG